jgi:hypothetical protein
MGCSQLMIIYSPVFVSFKFESCSKWKLFLSSIEWCTGIWQNILLSIFSLDHILHLYPKLRGTRDKSRPVPSWDGMDGTGRDTKVRDTGRDGTTFCSSRGALLVPILWGHSWESSSHILLRKQRSTFNSTLFDSPFEGLQSGVIILSLICG